MESPVRVFAYGSLGTDLGVSSLRGFVKLNRALDLFDLIYEMGDGKIMRKED